MQACVDWGVLIIFGTQGIKKKQLVRSMFTDNFFYFLWLWYHSYDKTLLLAKNRLYCGCFPVNYAIFSMIAFL